MTYIYIYIEREREREIRDAKRYECQEKRDYATPT